ncbi:MAG TPA: hypothetical protein VEH55_09040 [Gaiellaceae bacterium]|nr:hypothetical protein [Gaiellaceae bacterium]
MATGVDELDTGAEEAALNAVDVLSAGAVDGTAVVVVARVVVVAALALWSGTLAEPTASPATAAHAPTDAAATAPVRRRTRPRFRSRSRTRRRSSELIGRPPP